MGRFPSFFCTHRPDSRAPDQYDEPEGIFPDGKHTLVECDAHDPRGSQHIDLYKLALDGSGRYERITRFNDHRGYKASNPVVSDDGKYIAFQVAKVGDRAGVGRGILILDLEEFETLKAFGLEIGFQWVESGPLVRSSYHAADQVRALSIVHRQLYGG